MGIVLFTGLALGEVIQDFKLLVRTENPALALIKVRTISSDTNEILLKADETNRYKFRLLKSEEFCLRRVREAFPLVNQNKYQELWDHTKFPLGFAEELEAELVKFKLGSLSPVEKSTITSGVKGLDNSRPRKVSEEALMGEAYRLFQSMPKWQDLKEKWKTNNENSNNAALNIYNQLRIDKLDDFALKALIFVDDIDFNAQPDNSTIDELKEKLLVRSRENLPIDDLSKFSAKVSEVVENGGHYLHVVNNNGGVVFDLKLLGERLIKEYLEKKGIVSKGSSELDIINKIKDRKDLATDFSVTFAVRRGHQDSENIMRSEVREEDIEELLRKPGFKLLQAFKEAGLFKVVVKNNNYAGLGIDLADPNPEFKKAAEKATLVGIKGGINAIGMQLLKKESFIFGVSREVRTQYFTGLAWDEEGPLPQGFVAKLLPGVPAAEKFYTDNATEQNLSQFVQARQKMVDNLSNEQLVAEIAAMHSKGASFVAWFMPELLGETEEAKQALREIRNNLNTADTFAKAAENYIQGHNFPVLDYTLLELNKYFNRRVAEQILYKNGGTLGRAAYKLNSFTDSGAPNNLKTTPLSLSGEDNYPNERGNWRKVIVDYLLLPLDVAEKSLNTVIAPQERQLINPIAEAKEGEYIAFNAGYFWTAKLNREFNAISQNLKLGNDFVGGFIGFLKKKDRILAPLYNKGTMGRDEDGKIFFGRVKMEKGVVNKIADIELDKKINWLAFDSPELMQKKLRKEEELSGFEAVAFTPLYEGDSLIGGRKPYGPEGEVYGQVVKEIDSIRNSDKLLLTPEYKNRVQLVIIEDRVVAIKKGGQTVITPNGWVLSLSKEAYESLPQEVKGKLDKINLNQGSFTAEKNNSPEIKFTLEFKDERWKKAKEVMGDLTLLVNEGEGLPRNYFQDIYGRMQKEGWDLISSRRTQETDFAHVHNIAPRQIIGIANVNGKEQFFVFTFSGRTDYSGGADFDQALKIMTEELKRIYKEAKIEIKYAFNLDDGSSVSLIAFKDGKPFVLNVPGPGPNSKANQVRGVNSYFRLNFP